MDTALAAFRVGLGHRWKQRFESNKKRMDWGWFGTYSPLFVFATKQYVSSKRLIVYR